MILLPSRRITKPQSGGSVDLQRAHDSGTLYLSFADAGFTDRIGGGVVRNPGGLALGPNGKIATFNGAQQVNSPVWLGDSHTGLIVAARILATGAQSGTPGAAFGVYDSASQGGFGVGFDPSGNAGAALLTSGGAYLNARSAVGLNKWVTVFAQISGVNAGFSVAYVDGQPATVGQAGSYAGDPRVPREIAYGAQHRSSGFLRQFKGDVEWAAILRVAPDGGWRSLTDSLALELYESGYPYNLIKTTRRVYFDMGAGGGATSVASDLTAGYAIQGAVSSDAAASYSIRGGVSAQLDAQYDIRISAFANIGASYDIRGPVSADVAGSYTIRGAASSDSAASYDIRGAAYAATSPAYDIRGPVNADLSASYEILSASSVTADSTCAYPILGSVGSSASTSYGIRGAVASDRSSGYAIRGTVLVDLSTSYAIEAGMSSVYADLSTSYAIEGPVFGGGLSPADITAIRSGVRSELSAELLRISEIAKLHGLVQGAPLVVTPTSRTAGDVAQTVNTAGATTTVTRQ